MMTDNNSSNNNNSDLYGLDLITSYEEFGEGEEIDRAVTAALGSEPPIFGPAGGGSSPSAISDAASIFAEEIRRRGGSAGMRDRIASHPLFPRLLGSYLDCRKVGAPPEIATELEKIRRDNGEPFVDNAITVTSDPDLDYFMETYCEILEKYKSDLSRPFDEATTFLSKMQAQLNDLISSNPGASTSYVSGL